jgi:uncharacterized protein
MNQKIACIIAILFLMAGPALAETKEEIITFKVDGLNVVGTLALPDGGAKPVVLLFHGFTGVRDELPIKDANEGVFKRTARLLADAGFASLRIDFRGSGDSKDIAFSDTTVERQIADGLAAIPFVESDARVDGQKLAIIGWSQGGLVASAVAGRSPAPDAVVLWNAVAKPVDVFTGLLGADVVAAGLTVGDQEQKIKLPWGLEIALKQGFFDGLYALDPAKEISAYKGPLMVANGSEDTLVAPATGDLFLAAHEGTEERYTDKMDHVFNAFTGPDTLDKLVSATITFLGANLK